MVLEEFEILFNVLVKKCMAGKIKPDSKTIPDLINGYRYTLKQRAGLPNYGPDYAVVSRWNRDFYDRNRRKEVKNNAKS